MFTAGEIIIKKKAKYPCHFSGIFTFIAIDKLKKQSIISKYFIELFHKEKFLGRKLQIIINIIVVIAAIIHCFFSVLTFFFIHIVNLFLIISCLIFSIISDTLHLPYHHQKTPFVIRMEFFLS